MDMNASTVALAAISCLAAPVRIICAAGLGTICWLPLTSSTSRIDPDGFTTYRDTDNPDDIAFGAPGFKGETGSVYDSLEGGSGSDILFLGDNDEASGGTGDDLFLLGDWISPSGPALITDHNSSEDIILIGLSEQNADAVVSTFTAPDGLSGQILIDGQIVANIQGNITNSGGLGGYVQILIYED